ncbi:hypothetical protein ACTFR8_28415 [Bacillus cereus group sp. MYBK15-3]|uniref:hypothetical protein n=1 Tax=unclassified Bacillus cereus group TaxID=2750818 RepID=UPI002A2682BD|nr:hypothetical protein [Bacillus cereus]
MKTVIFTLELVEGNPITKEVEFDINTPDEVIAKQWNDWIIQTLGDKADWHIK